MTIPIPIPIGTTHVAAVRGAVWKFVSCTHCQERYAYLLELEATGTAHDVAFTDGEGSVKLAQAIAADNLLQKSRNVVLPVPCPLCGSYQDDMVELLKQEASINRVQLAGLAIAILAFIPLLFDTVSGWFLTIPVAVVGLILVVYGSVIAFRLDPNGCDSESRKALGRRYAVFGDALGELLTAHASAAQEAQPESPHD